MTAPNDSTAALPAEATPVEGAADAAADAKPKKDDELDEAQRREKALARLMHRISEHADFPTLRDSIGGIQKIARSDRAHLNQLSGLVLNDVGMTSKLLRIINAAFYVSVGGGSITSMDRAVALMGFESVGMLAASLMLFEKAPKGRDGEAVRHACSKALLSGLLAQQLCRSTRHVESVYLTALFMNLGKMLVVMHFPNDARAIQAKVDDAVGKLVRQAEANAALHTGAVKQAPQGPSAAQVHEVRERISREVLGLTLEELGLEVARQWGWPDNLSQHLRCMYPADPTQEAGQEEYLRVLCTAFV
jgi:HD-like signal output (HDOD) protein